MKKTILVTGCSYGLGYALAKQLAQADCIVYAVGRNKELLDTLSELNNNIKPIVADISTVFGRLRITDAVRQQSISIIHNAAIIEPAQFIDLSEESLRQQFEVNYFAPLLITKMLLPQLQNNRVLHISSGAADLALAGLMPYCATKAALEHTTHCLNAEFASHNIYFANLRQGMVDTPMQSKLRETDKSVLSNRDFYVEAQKQKKLSSADDVAGFVVRVMLNTDDIAFSNTEWIYSNPAV